MSETPTEKGCTEDETLDSAGSRKQAPGHIPARTISEAISDPTGVDELAQLMSRGVPEPLRSLLANDPDGNRKQASLRAFIQDLTKRITPPTTVEELVDVAMRGAAWLPRNLRDSDPDESREMPANPESPEPPATGHESVPREEEVDDNETLEDIRKRVKATSDRMAQDLERILGPLRKHYEKTEARTRKELRKEHPDLAGEVEDDLVVMRMGLEAMKTLSAKHARRRGPGGQGGNG